MGATLSSQPSNDSLRAFLLGQAKQWGSPASPTEAQQHEAAGALFLSRATDTTLTDSSRKKATYVLAAIEFDRAIAIAPWQASAYLNRGIALQGAGELQQALRSFDLFLIASDSASAVDARSRIDEINALFKARRELELQEQRRIAEAEREALERKTRLMEYTVELQARPSDDSLRLRIVRMSRQLNPAPVVSPEARELEGSATFFFKEASDASKADSVKARSTFLRAASEFEKASNAAPWHLDFYFNQGLSLEGAGALSSAITKYEFYLAAAPDASDAGETQTRIGRLKAALLQQREREAAEARQRQEAEEAAERARRVYLNGDLRIRLWDGGPIRAKSVVIRDASVEIACGGIQPVTLCPDGGPYSFQRGLLKDVAKPRRHGMAGLYTGLAIGSAGFLAIAMNSAIKDTLPDGLPDDEKQSKALTAAFSVFIGSFVVGSAIGAMVVTWEPLYPNPQRTSSIRSRTGRLGLAYRR